MEHHHSPGVKESDISERNEKRRHGKDMATCSHSNDISNIITYKFRGILRLQVNSQAVGQRNMM